MRYKLYEMLPDGDLKLIGHTSRQLSSRPFPETVSHALWPDVLDRSPPKIGEKPEKLTCHRLDISHISDRRGQLFLVVREVFEELWDYEGFTKLPLDGRAIFH